MSGTEQYISEANRKRSYRILDMIIYQTLPNNQTLHYSVRITVDEIDNLSVASVFYISSGCIGFLFKKLTAKYLIAGYGVGK